MRDEAAASSTVKKCMKYGSGDGFMKCEKFRKRFRRKTVYEAHILKCVDDKTGGDTMERAIEMAHDIVYKETCVQKCGRQDVNPKLAAVLFNADTDCRTGNNFKWLPSLSTNEASKDQSYEFPCFPCGIIGGALTLFGLKCCVTPDL